MSRSELSPAQLAELDALDRILARQQVDEEHLELAALVDSVRANAPRIEPAFRERLGEEVERRRARRGFPRLDARRLALAGSGLVAAAVTLTIVISSGLLGGASQPAAPQRSALPSVGPQAHPKVSTRAAPSDGLATAQSGAPGPQALAPAATPAGRLVQRSSTLVMTTPGSSVQRVANGVVTQTEQRGGVVASSYVTLEGPHSQAVFDLQVPSGRLASLVTALSSLASVQSLNQNTSDITHAYDRATGRLAEQRAERASLLKQLAVAPTQTDVTTLTNQLHTLDRAIAAQVRIVDRLRNEGHTAALAVNVSAAAAPAHHTGGAAGGPFGRAFSKSLHVLVEILAVALVVLAIVLPFALTALAVWWSGAALRQRLRERAVRAA